MIFPYVCRMKQLNILFKKWLYVLAGILFIALFAQMTLEVPLHEQEIPISGQTFAVLLVGFLLREKWGTIALIGYLLAGILGLPVFADGASGIEAIQGGTGGFLIGFVVGAAVVGWMGSQGWGRSFWKCLLAMFIGTAVIMTFGVARLTWLYNFENALEWGFYPFLIGAGVKIFVGAGVVFFLEKRR
ncbi:MAG: biotin transport system substrate-specific component [Saprospiraceae bacterium]|jgi:biotin transport system substrate-specific component